MVLANICVGDTSVFVWSTLPELCSLVMICFHCECLDLGLLRVMFIIRVKQWSCRNLLKMMFSGFLKHP